MLLDVKGFYSLLPPFMDAPQNHSDAKGVTKGPSVFILKCIFMGTKWDDGYFLDDQYCNGLMSTIKSFQASQNIDSDGNFGQDTRGAFQAALGIHVDKIPYSIMRIPDMALQPSGEILMWPPEAMIVSGYGEQFRTPDGDYRLLPTYMDFPGAHETPIGSTMGPSVFILKCLFLGTEYWSPEVLMNVGFCENLANVIANFQAKNSTDVDKCFGQGTRERFYEKFQRNLEMIPRKILFGSDTAIQPNGDVCAWPPQVVIG